MEDFGLDLTDLTSQPPKPRNVSNSEVTSFLSCKRKYDFEFMQELMPKETPAPLSRGTLGHYAFELYCRARMNGASHNEAFKASMDAFANPPEPTSMEIILETQFLYTRYMEHHQGWPEWEILGVEQQVDLPLTSTLNMTIRYDLYVKDKATGKCYIGDYKFAYEFWSYEDHDLNPQMPKYIATLQANGIRCDGGFLEEIRTRPLGAEKSRDTRNLWRRTMYVPSGAKKRSVLDQHVKAALQIERHRTLTPEERELESIPVLNKHGVCKFCNFRDLCNSMLEGKKDLSVDIRVGYVQNTYGYNKDDENGIDF